MKSLLILRHAKSSWHDTDLADHDRPLNKRGKRDAPKMGELLARRKLTPDRILSSTARRACDTAAVVADRCGFEHSIEWSERLYLARPDEIIDLLRGVDDEARSVLLVGHNPGLEQLLGLLTDDDQPLPTAALAHLEIDIPHWSQLDFRSPASLAHVWRPRELE